MSDDRTPDEETPETPAEETPAAAEESTPPVADAPSDEQPSAGAPDAPVAEQADAVEAEATPDEAETPDAPEEPQADAADDDGDDEPTPREKPLIPGADLEVDIVTESSESRSAYSEDADDQPIAAVEINLAADARYRATGKRKTAVARVTLRPGTGAYTINGRPLDAFFPRNTLQRNIRQPLETVGYEDRMDVVARMHGGGVSSQAGALRHGISRALLEADPNLRGELKRRGFLTRDARAKERKKAGLKKARKRPQFSKR